ncbi:uncharacterized protein LOC106472258, partial [Limulus polyphemus]|uniref:Uncharacterized protein LOC106472258 n=1 Tax=Limulus polyphemus TaxID=6850 RepID=A0ABM1TL05_LIMPO
VHFDPKITNEKYTLYEVEGTNLFVVTNYSKANKNCTCDTQTELCKIWNYVKYSGSPYFTSVDDFDLCENRLQYSSRNKYLPCTPHVNDNTRKVPRHDVIKDLPLCFDPGCQKKKNKSTCSIFPACEWREKEAFRREMCVSFLDKDPVLENDVAFLLYSVSASFCFVFVAVVCFLVVQKSCRKKAISKQSTHSTSSCHENPAFSEDSRDSCEDLYL